MGLPGVKVGPLDPDSTSGLGHVGHHGATARHLIRLHTQLHPPALTRQLARTLAEPQTKGLDLEEVRDYLGGLRRENGDPVVPVGAVVAAAAVHGERDSGFVLTFTYRMPSGRTGKWFAPYSHEDLPASYDAGAELARVKQMTDRGVVSFDAEGTRVEILERQLRDARREASALRRHVDAGGHGDAPDAPEGEGSAAPDIRGDEGVREDLEQLRRERDELRERVSQFEAARAAQAGGVPIAGAGELLGSGDGSASENEPLEGYDAMNAQDVAKVLRDRDTDRGTVERVLAYERSHQNRSTVTGAGEAALDRQE